jgi:FMN phosphatase YigB (HAD superfamily)
MRSAVKLAPGVVEELTADEEKAFDEMRDSEVRFARGDRELVGPTGQPLERPPVEQLPAPARTARRTLQADERGAMAGFEEPAAIPQPEPGPAATIGAPPAEPPTAEPPAEPDWKSRAEKAEGEHQTLSTRATQFLQALQSAAAQGRGDEVARLLQVQPPPQQQQPAQPQPQAAPGTWGAPQQPQPQGGIPDPNQDPVGHIVGRLQQAETYIGQLETRRQQEANQQQQTVAQLQQLQQIHGVIGRAQELEREFEASTPDYADAVKTLTDARKRELEIAGITDPLQRDAMVKNEGFGVALNALQQGANPAQRIYQLAQARGHVPQAQVRTAQDRLRNIAAGQQQAMTLGNARGSGPVPMTVNRLLEMSEADFDKALQTAEGLALLGA